MANKQTKMQGNAKRVLIEQPKTWKHAQPAKGWPISKQERWETLNESLLSNHKNNTMHKQLKDVQ